MNDAGSKIPLCKSEWLQDACIEFGRRFAKHNPFSSFTAAVEICEHEGENLERLTFWASTWHGTLVNLTLWEDHIVWIGVILRAAQNNPEYKVGFYPQCTHFDFGRIAEAFRDTVAVSTRLCYNECPLPSLRRIWDHSGDVEIEGMLVEMPKVRLTDVA